MFFANIFEKFRLRLFNLARHHNMWQSWCKIQFPFRQQKSSKNGMQFFSSLDVVLVRLSNDLTEFVLNFADFFSRHPALKFGGHAVFSSSLILKGFTIGHFTWVSLFFVGFSPAPGRAHRSCWPWWRRTRGPPPPGWGERGAPSSCPGTSARPLSSRTSTGSPCPTG